jgi:hypothetical protein
MLNVNTVNISIVNIAGNIALDVIVSAAPFVIVLVALDHNTSPVE